MVYFNVLQTQGNALDRIPSYACYSVFKDRTKALAPGLSTSNRALPPRSREDFRAGFRKGGVSTSAVPHRQGVSPKKSSDRLSTGGA